MKKIVLALLATVATVGVAHAQGQSSIAPRAYVGAGVIWYDNQFHIPQATNVDSDKWKASGKIFGGSEFDQIWGVEAGWSRFREANADFTRNGIRQRASADGYGAYLAGKATAPINPHLAVYGKLGVAYTKADVSFSAPALPCRKQDDTDTATDTGVYVGVGVEYKFSPEWSAVAEYERYGKEKDIGAKPNILSIAAKYSF